MKRFRFPLDRLLKLRERIERERAAALGGALREASARELERARAAEAALRAGEQAAQAATGGRTAGELRNLEWARDAATRAADAAAGSHRAAEDQVEAERARWSTARRDQRSVEKLRERRLADWREAAGREERRDMDELASRRHATGEGEGEA